MFANTKINKTIENKIQNADIPRVLYENMRTDSNLRELGSYTEEIFLTESYETSKVLEHKYLQYFEEAGIKEFPSGHAENARFKDLFNGYTARVFVLEKENERMYFYYGLKKDFIEKPQNMSQLRDVMVEELARLKRIMNRDGSIEQNAPEFGKIVNNTAEKMVKGMNKPVEKLVMVYRKKN